MKISGSGKIPAGEYNEIISVSGSAKIEGHLFCEELYGSGSVKAKGRVECREDVKISGTMSVEQGLKAKNIKVSGACKINGDCVAESEIKISGAINCGGELKGTDISLSGRVEAERGIEAEIICVSGSVYSDGLVNAEEVEIKLSGNNRSKVGSIGAGTVKIYSTQRSGVLSRLPLFSSLLGNSGCLVTVNESIEGDVIAIEQVCTPKVVGKSVSIGQGCQIELVQYSDNIEIHPDAKVGKYERINL